MPLNLIFIEQKDEIDNLENFINEESIVISLCPSVSLGLDKKGIKFFSTLDFFGKKGHEFVHKNSKKIVDDLRPFLKNLRNQNIQYAFERTWIFYFRFHLNYCLSMLFIINQTVKKFNPDLLISSQSSLNDNLLSGIIKLYGLANHVKTRVVNKKFKKSSHKIIKKIAKRIIFEFQLTFIKYFLKNKSLILAPEDSYNMPSLLSKVSQNLNYPLPVYLKVQRKFLWRRVSEMLRGKSFSFISFPSESLFKSKNSFSDQLLISANKIKRHISNNSKLTSFFGFNINIFLNKYIENILSLRMVELNTEIATLRRVLNHLKPDKVFAQHSLGISYALGEVCLESNIPAMLISHGSHSPHNDEFAKYEWVIHSHTLINSHYPFVAIQTPLAKLFLKMSDNLISKKIETGPLLLAGERKYNNIRQTRDKIFNKNADKFIVLHAGTPKGWNSLRPWIFETIDEYIKNINDVITAVEEISGMFLAVRFRPQAGLSFDAFRLLLKDSNSYEIYTEGDIKDYLLASDLLISYSSTTIEEALQSQLPVLQYDPSAQYVHISGQILSKSDQKNVSEIYSVHSNNDLLPALNWCMLNHNNNLSHVWSRYIIESDNKMEWLSLMENSEC